MAQREGELLGILVVAHGDSEVDVAREPRLGAGRHGEAPDEGPSTTQFVQ
ncbi:MAG: hypothetical protein Q8K32_32325 [Archangium sp.]|nr:hypothetical protein [Archangium sp.]